MPDFFKKKNNNKNKKKKKIKNLKIMWKEIKKTSSNNPNHLFSTAIKVNNVTITSPTDIANAFNNYFAKTAIDIIKIL